MLAAAVILYNPEENFISNLRSYYHHVDKIFVFDNSETGNDAKHVLSAMHKVEYYQDFENAGIAKRLNQAAEMAVRQGFDWLLTMDQDTFFTDDSIENYLQCFQNYPDKNNVAVFGTGYGREEKSSEKNCTTTAICELITSGMLVNLKWFTKLEGFDEALFIDGVDHDYTIKAKIKDLEVIQFSNIFIKHQLGHLVHRSSIKTFFLAKKKKIIHSPLRCYYIYRNMLYLEQKFTAHPHLIKQIKKTTTQHILRCLFYGRDSLHLIKYLVAAKKDFKNKNMGKIKRTL